MATTENPAETRVLEGREDVSIGVERYFTSDGDDPFETVDWEQRTALIPGKDGPSFEQKDVEFPSFWSQTATNIVAQKYFRGKLNTPQREHSVRQMIGRVTDTITTWGVKDGYFVDQAEADTFHAELTHLLLHQMVAFNSPVWFNVGFEENPQCSCLLHPVGGRLDGLDPGLDHQGGTGVPGRLRLGHQPVQAALIEGAAVQGRLRLRAGLVHARRRRVRRHHQVGWQDPPRGQDGGAERRPPGHRGVHLVQAARGGEGARAAGGRLRHEPGLARLGLDPVPERQQLGARDRRVHAGRAGGRGVEPDGTHRRLRRGHGARPRPDAPDLGGGLEVRRSRHALRHHHERLAHVPGQRTDQRK